MGGGEGGKNNHLRSRWPFAAVIMQLQDMTYCDKEAKPLSFQIRTVTLSLGTQARGTKHQQNPKRDRLCYDFHPQRQTHSGWPLSPPVHPQLRGPMVLLNNLPQPTKRVMGPNPQDPL